MRSTNPASSRRYFCYHVMAGPGPTAGSAVAAVTTLAIHDGATPHRFYQNMHIAEVGGPVAAIVKAIRYLDAYHGDECVQRVESQIRGLGSVPQSEAALPPLPDPCRTPAVSEESFTTG